MKSEQQKAVSQTEAIAMIDEEIKRLQSELYKAINSLDSTKINRLTIQIEILEYIKLKIIV